MLTMAELIQTAARASVETGLPMHRLQVLVHDGLIAIKPVPAANEHVHLQDLIETAQRFGGRVAFSLDFDAPNPRAVIDKSTDVVNPYEVKKGGG